PVRVVVKSNSSFLQRGFLVADTPGLASVNPAHRRATLQFLPTADAVLYLIDTQQPFTEGDASFLGIIRQHIDSIFIVQTKIDLWEQPQSDGRLAWEHARERIARLAAVHAPGTYVFALSARRYVQGALDDDADARERSRFPVFLAALDASLIKRTGRTRLRRAGETAAATALDERRQIERDLEMLALDEQTLHAKRDALVPELQRLDDELRAQRDRLMDDGLGERRALDDRGRMLADELERALSQSFDTSDVARLRDRERLHVLVDRVVAGVAGEFAQTTSDTVVDDLDAALERARALVPLRWSSNDTAARAFGAQPGSSLWSGDVRAAIAATIVLEAIGGPAIALVHDVASRFSSRPPGGYMKRELIADLRTEIYPRLRVEIGAFADAVGARVQHVYDDLGQSIARAVLAKRDGDLGSIERAIRAHASASVISAASDLRQRAGAIEQEAARVNGIVAAFMDLDDETPAADEGPADIRASHAQPSFDASSYNRGLRPERWRVAVIGALRRGKSSLIDALAGRRVLTDDAAGSVRFPVHVRYGEREAAYALDPDGRWSEIEFAAAADAAAHRPVLVLVPWSLPRELVLVHAPAFDSGDAHAEDINVTVANEASEVLCLFSRQLSDRELDLFERIAELGRPMLFAHTIADNEAPNERRNVVTLAADYLKVRTIPAERIFVISAAEYARARESGRAPAGWNEMEALRSTLEAHAEAHMARLERLAKARVTTQGPAGGQNAAPRGEPQQGKRGILNRIFGSRR
ncbi:MAG TPA: dynamin family protein, partial [Candidatus Baltobacteraceae bacterium]|nr:dynamin family protein [Candidatus Baltobacteraceae bacterium]